MAEAFSSRFHAFNFCFGRRIALRGFDVRALLPQKDEWVRIRHRLDAAFVLLERYAPARFAMLQRDIRRVWVTGIPSRGAFVRERAMCVLDFDFVTGDSTRHEEIALTMVHEGTHARLARAGFGYEEQLRARIERLCIGSELVVARRLPAAEELVAETFERLTWDDATWSSEAIRHRHLDALQDLGWAGRLGYSLARAIRPSLR
jgi:hypothetical protein